MSRKSRIEVPHVIPETIEEKKLHETAPERARVRKERKQRSQEMAEFITTNQPWIDVTHEELQLN